MRLAMQVTQSGDLIAEGRIVAAPPREAAGDPEGDNAHAEPPEQDHVPADEEEVAVPTLVSTFWRPVLPWIHPSGSKY